MNVHHYTNDGRTWVVVPPPKRCVWAMPAVYTVEEAARLHYELGLVIAKIDAPKEAAEAEFARVAAGYTKEIAE